MAMKYNAAVILFYVLTFENEQCQPYQWNEEIENHDNNPYKEKCDYIIPYRSDLLWYRIGYIGNLDRIKSDFNIILHNIRYPKEIKYEDRKNDSKRYTGQQLYPVEPETSGIGKNAFVHRPDYNQEGACQ